MSRKEARLHTDAVREALARESLAPAMTPDASWKNGEGRDLASYSIDLGISVDEFLSADCIVDLGSGPTVKPLTEILDKARAKNQKPPRMIAVSAGYRDSGKRAHLDQALKSHSVNGEIEILDSFAHEAPIPKGIATYVVAEYLFEHLVDEDIVPTLSLMVESLAPGGKAVISRYAAPKSAEEVGLPRGTNMPSHVRESAENNPGVRLRNEIYGYAERMISGMPEYRLRAEPVPSVESAGKWYRHERIVIERIKNPAVRG
jgi:hypothetical protein